MRLASAARSCFDFVAALELAGSDCEQLQRVLERRRSVVRNAKAFLENKSNIFLRLSAAVPREMRILTKILMSYKKPFRLP